MDQPTLEQAFNVPTTDLKKLLNTAAIALGERKCLGSSSRSKAAKAARSEAVLQAIHSLPLFAGFFERCIKRYPAFVASMTASIARSCDEDYRQWQMMKKREEARTAGPQDAAVATKSATPAQLPTPPATPRKQTPAPKCITKTSISAKKRRADRTKTGTSPLKKRTKVGSRKG